MGWDVGGLISEEVRKTLMPRGGDRIAGNISYSLRAESRFGNSLDEEVREDNLSDKRVLVVGAGALGNFAALGLALSGVGNIDILDHDDVDPTNLNRQILFYDSVGEKKAEALALKIGRINPNIRARGLVGEISPDSGMLFQQNKYDVVLDCVDSFAVRAIINYFAIRNQIPLVSGGTNPTSGQVVVYKPIKSACLDCRLGVEEALARELEASSCRYAPDPSVIMSNQVVGGMVVGETVKVLSDSYGPAVSRILKYDSTVPQRGGLVGIEEACNCKKPGPAEWISGLKEKQTDV